MIEKTNGATEAFFDIFELAQRWHQHAESVRRRVRRGEVKAVIIGRKILIARTEVERIEAENTRN